MIDVEFACCITNSLLLARQRKKEREREQERNREREREREDEEQSSIQLIKVEDSGLSLHWRFFLTSTLLASVCFSLLPLFLPFLHVFCGRDGQGRGINGVL